MHPAKWAPHSAHESVSRSAVPAPSPEADAGTHSDGEGASVPPAVQGFLSAVREFYIDRTQRPTPERPCTFLSLSRIAHLCEQGEHTPDCSLLCLYLTAAFSSRVIVNRSFLRVREGQELSAESVSRVPFSTHCSGIDLPQLRSAFELVEAHSSDARDAVTQVCVGAGVGEQGA